MNLNIHETQRRRGEEVIVQVPITATHSPDLHNQRCVIAAILDDDTAQVHVMDGGPLSLATANGTVHGLGMNGPKEGRNVPVTWLRTPLPD